MDNIIESCEFYNYRPPISENLNEARYQFSITAHNEDIVTQPSGSLLVINGVLEVSKMENNTITKHNEIDLTKNWFVSNGILHLFDTIDYYIGDVKIDSIRKPGVSALLKGLASYGNFVSLENVGFKSCNDSSAQIMVKTGHFSATIPLSFIMGFFEDYKQFVYRMPQKLVFFRNMGEPRNCLYLTDSKDSATITIKEIVWRMPQIKFTIPYETQVRKEILNDTSYSLLYRHWFYQSITTPTGATEYMWDFPVAYSKTKYILIANISSSNLSTLWYHNIDLQIWQGYLDQW